MMLKVLRLHISAVNGNEWLSSSIPIGSETRSVPRVGPDMLQKIQIPAPTENGTCVSQSVDRVGCCSTPILYSAGTRFESRSYTGCRN
jgi:hypothetical protein